MELSTVPAPTLDTESEPAFLGTPLLQSGGELPTGRQQMAAAAPEQRQGYKHISRVGKVVRSPQQPLDCCQHLPAELSVHHSPGTEGQPQKNWVTDFFPTQQRTWPGIACLKAAGN